MALAYSCRGRTESRGGVAVAAAFQLTKTNDYHLEQTHLPKSCAICAINKFAVQTEKERGREREEEEGETCAWHIYKSLQTAGNRQFVLVKAEQIINLKLAANVATATLKLKLKFSRESKKRAERAGTINQANCGTDRERERQRKRDRTKDKLLHKNAL